MSLAKAIQHKKEHRKEYHDSRAIDKTCRNHGSCRFCEGNRRHKELLQNECFRVDMEEYLNTLR